MEYPSHLNKTSQTRRAFCESTWSYSMRSKSTIIGVSHSNRLDWLVTMYKRTSYEWGVVVCPTFQGPIEKNGEILAWTPSCDHQRDPHEELTYAGYSAAHSVEVAFLQASLGGGALEAACELNFDRSTHLLPPELSIKRKAKPSGQHPLFPQHASTSKLHNSLPPRRPRRPRLFTPVHAHEHPAAKRPYCCPIADWRL
jgi:hypothetical protein